jgi:hypothetical protein
VLARTQVCALDGDLREEYVVNQLADIVLPAGPSLPELEDYLLVAGARSVSVGEVDSLGAGPWKYGFFSETGYHVFSDATAVSQVVLENGGAAFALSGAGDGSTEQQVVPFSRIQDVGIAVSDDLSARSIFFTTHDDDVITVLADAFDSDILGAADSDAIDAAAMTTTEWMVKASGGFVLELRRAGLTPRLILPSVLTESNPAVAKRNQMWRALRAANPDGK